VRVAIVGMGRWGTQIYRALKPLCYVWPCPTRAETDAMMADSSVDAVVIATPIGTHFALAERALLAGKHVFVEKPMCVFTSAAERLVYLAAVQSRTLFVGHIFAYHPSFATLAETARANEIESIHCTWRKFGTYSDDITQNLVSHDIALALILCGAEPTDFEVLTRIGVVSDVDIIRLRMYLGKTQCLIDIDRNSPLKTHKTLSVKLKGCAPYETDLLRWVPPEEPLTREMLAFLDACSGGPPPITDGLHGLKVVRAVQTINEMT